MFRNSGQVQKVSVSGTKTRLQKKYSRLENKPTNREKEHLLTVSIEIPELYHISQTLTLFIHIGT